MKKVLFFLFLAFPLALNAQTGSTGQPQAASSTESLPGYIDGRFSPVGGLTDQTLKQIEEAKKISIHIAGSSFRSDVEAGKLTVRGWDLKEKKITINPDQVRTKENAESYAQQLVLADPNIEELSAQDGSIELTYMTKGKLFGFIPKKLLATVSVTVPSMTDTKAATVHVHFPWYSFLAVKEMSASSIKTFVAADVELINSVDQKQKVAQYLGAVATMLRTKR